MKIYSLKKTLFIIIVFFTIIIPVFIALLFSLNLYQTQIQGIKHNQVQVLSQVKTETEQFMHNIENMSSYIKKFYSVKQHDLLKNIVQINEEISSILILNADGIIQDFYAEHDLKVYEGYDYSKKSYFKMLKGGREEFWSDVFLSTINQAQSLAYSFKMNNQIGVVFFDLNHLSKYLEQFVNSDNSHMIRIYDSEGVLLLNPDKPHLQAQKEYSILESVFVDLIHKSEPLEQKVYLNTSFEERDIGMYDSIDKNGWYILVRDNFDNILNDLVKAFIQISLVTLCIIFVMLFIIYKYIRELFISLDELKIVTTNIAKGDYETPVNITSFEELNSLVYGLHFMQQEIEKREQGLQKSVENFKKLIDTTMEGIVTIANGKCQYANQIALNILGYSNKNEIQNLEFKSLVSNKDRSVFDKVMKKNFSSIELEFVKKDKSLISVLIQGKEFELNDEKITLIAIIDITELKEKEQMLYHQSKMAALGEMIGNISHQWRQPLSTISTLASGMRFQKEYGQLEEKDFFQNMDLICSTTKYLSKTIDDFRNFLSVNKEMKEFNLSDAINSGITLVESSLKNNFIKMKVELEKNISIAGFENEFIQALINILTNSKDALKNIEKEDDRILCISLKKEKDSIIIIVQDSAGGIPENILPKIFDPYFTTKHKSQGTGIGLYMTHQIICEHMKGTISATNRKFTHENTIFMGAQFKIEFKI